MEGKAENSTSSIVGGGENQPIRVLCAVCTAENWYVPPLQTGVIGPGATHTTATTTTSVPPRIPTPSAPAPVAEQPGSS